MEISKVEREQAISRLTEMGAEEWRARKFVLDVCEYINDADVPEALIYVGWEMLTQIKSDEENEITAPLSEIKMDDTTFRFGVAAVDATLTPYERMFNSLKARLNLYRRVKAL